MNIEQIAIIPIITGLVSMLNGLKLPKTYSSLVSLLIGVVLGVVYINPGDIKMGVLVGIVYGLSASGLYSSGKTVAKTIKK